MSRELKDIWIEEISLVDSPANGIELMLVKNEDRSSLFSQISQEFDRDKISKNLSDDVIDESLATFSRYFNELPKDMKAAIATVSETFSKESEDMDISDAKKMLMDEYGLDEDELVAKLSGEPTVDEKLKAFQEQIQELKQALESEEEEEEEEVEEVDVSEMEFTDEQLDSIKERYDLHDEDEIDELFEEVFQGKEKEENE